MKNCLIWLIQFYRKHLSLTLFKQRRCAFRDTCSTYALRIARTQNLTTAVKLIYERWIKKQCSAYALYNVRGYLSWSEGYDHLPKDLNSWVHDMMENKKELQTILSNVSVQLLFTLPQLNLWWCILDLAKAKVIVYHLNVLPQSRLKN
jgi:putative component of membrane protein insertase Oxa1/YidC/SpoIIIJ protein YidD